MPAPSRITSSAAAGEISPSRYRIVNRIGAGGMGEAFLAVMQCVGGASKPVVLKRLWPALATNPDFVAMFLDEARLSLRLNHPNVVHAYEVGWLDDGYYLSMEHIDGVSLGELVLRLVPDGTLRLPVALKVVSEILAALEYVHDLTDVTGRPLGIIHRDVSPQNVFLTYDGSVKLVDFGVASSAANNHHQPQGTIKGRLGYMAPEQARGGPVDRRADLFSVGVMLWELAAGRRLWAGLDQARLARRSRTDQPAPALSLGAGVEAPLAALCARALAMDPDDRFATASEFQTALSRVSGAIATTRQLGELMRQTFAESRLAIQSMIRRNTLEIDLSVFSPAQTDESDAPLLDLTDDAVLVVDDSPAPLTINNTTMAGRDWWRPRSAAWFGPLAVLLAAGAALAVASGRRSVAQLEPPRSAQRLPAIPAPAPSEPAQPGPIPIAAQLASGEEAVVRGRRSVATGRSRLVDQMPARAPIRPENEVAAIGALAQDQFDLAFYYDALRLARQAARLAPDQARYQLLAGDAAVKLGLNADAAAAYARARVLQPGDASIRARLDRLLPTARSLPPAEPPRRRTLPIETIDPYAADLTAAP
jgi:serine/threonine protein kinase